MTEYPSNKYRCEESGLTDIAFSKYAELLAIMKIDGFRFRHRRGQALDIMREFQDAVFGDTFDEVEGYIEGHVESCEGCRPVYEKAMKTVTRTASIFKKEDRELQPPDSKFVI